MFIWATCLDGSSINLSKVDAFVVGSVTPKETDEGNATPPPPPTQLCVFALIGTNTYPLRVCNSQTECQQTIQAVLGNLKAEYEKSKSRLILPPGV